MQLDCTNECGGDAMRDCNDDCVLPGQEYHHEEYFCEESDSSGILLDLSTRTLTCFAVADTGNCNPRTPSCNFVNCAVDTMYKETVINCSWNLPTCDTTYTIEDEIDIIVCNKYDSSDWLSDGVCDFELTNCEEFNFDGGDCDLVDCLGTHFSEELCISLFNAGCTTGEASWIGDGGCDVGQNDLGLNFNCAEWDYDGGDCSSNSRISKTGITKKWRDKK